MKSLLRGSGLGAALLLLALPGLGCAQAITAPNMDTLRQQGYVLMDDISTPLLHHVRTGDPYELRILAAGDGSSGIMRAEHPARRRARADDEFERAAVAASWGGFIHERAAELRAARAYLIELEHSWGEYDFVHRRFPVKLSMNKHAFRGGGSNFCGGAFQRAGTMALRTACLVSPQLNQFAAPLSVFPLADTELARLIKQRQLPVALFAVAEPQGSYAVLKGKELRYMPGAEIVTAAGVQPVLITDLLLVDARDAAGTILATSHVADSRRQPTAPAVQPAPPAQPAQPLQPTAARWQELIRDPVGTTFVERGSARRDGALVQATMLMTFSQPAAGAARSGVGRYVFDCAERSVRQLDLQGFGQAMGTGSVLEHDTAARTLSVTRGSNLELMLNHACNLDTAAASP